MIITEPKPRFSQATGKPVDSTAWVKEHRCDYCGLVLDEQYNPPSYDFNYRDHDPCFGSYPGEQQCSEALAEAEIDIHEFLGEPYIFCCQFICDGMDVERDWKPCQLMLANELMFHNTQGKGYFKDCDSFIDAWRASRMRALRKLLEDGTITAENLRR